MSTPRVIESQASAGWGIVLAAGATTGNSNTLPSTRRLFLKELLREGTYQHPLTPWPEPLVVTPSLIDEWVRSTNAAIAAGVDVWVPDTHSFRAEDNRGFVRRVFRATVAGDPTVQALFGEVEITDPATAEQIGTSIRKVSVLLMDLADGVGNHFGERVVHVALTPSPVAPRQENFVALSIGSGTTEPVQAPVLVPEQPGDNTMPFKPTEKISKALGIALTADVTAEAIEAGIDALLTRAETAEKGLADLKATPPPTVERLLSVDGTQPLFKRAHAAKAKSVALTIAAAKSAGKVNGAMEAALGTLLGIETGFALSADGAAAPVDVAQVVEALVDAIPANAVVPLNQQLKGTQPAAGQPSPSPDPFDTPEKARAEADRMLKSAGFVKSAK
jgi:hypothetical protein